MLNGVMTLAEAAELWQLSKIYKEPQKFLMRRVIRNKHRLEGLASLSGNIWLITEEGMNRLYSNEGRIKELKQIIQEHLEKGEAVPKRVMNEYNKLNEKEND